jgi:hypothetical protein
MKPKWPKIILLLAIVLLAYGFFAFDLQQYLTLTHLKSQQQAFQNYYADNQALTMGGYMAMYIAVTALSLPGATVMSLAGGALFGIWTGLLLVSFASTIGATLAFLVSRFLLRDYVQNKFGDKLKAVNESFRKDGPCYIFKFRLAMALQGDAAEGISVGDVWESWHAQGHDADELAAQLNWQPEILQTIDAYRGMAARYTFPTLDEVESVLSPWFERVEQYQHDYEFGENCPTLVLKPVRE